MESERAKPLGHIGGLLTFQEAAAALGLPYFKVQRAAKNGMIPTYSLFNARKYVKLCDIAAAMSAERN